MKASEMLKQAQAYEVAAEAKEAQEACKARAEDAATRVPKDQIDKVGSILTSSLVNRFERLFELGADDDERRVVELELKDIQLPPSRAVAVGVGGATVRVSKMVSSRHPGTREMSHYDLGIEHASDNIAAAIGGSSLGSVTVEAGDVNSAFNTKDCDTFTEARARLATVIGVADSMATVEAAAGLAKTWPATPEQVWADSLLISQPEPAAA